MSYADLNQAMANLGAGVGNIASGYQAGLAAQRKAHAERAIAFAKNKDFVNARKYAMLANPDATLPEFMGEMKKVTGLAPTSIGSAPAPSSIAGTKQAAAQKMAAMPTPMGLTPQRLNLTGAANLPTDLSKPFAQPTTPAAPTWQTPTGGGASQLPSLPQQMPVSLGMQEDKNTPDPNNPENLMKMLGYLGVAKPEPKYVDQPGYGLTEITPEFAGQPASFKTVRPEKLGVKDAAELRRRANETEFEWKQRREMANQEDATRRWIAGIGDATDRWKANLATNAKAAGLGDDQARAISAIGNMVRGMYPRRKNGLTNDYTETDDEYEARVAPVMKAYLGVSGIRLPELPADASVVPPAPPAAPATPPPAPTQSSWWPSFGNPLNSRPAAPGTPPPIPQVPQAPAAPSARATAATTAESQRRASNGTAVANLVRTRFPGVKVQKVDPTTGDVLVDIRGLDARTKRMLRDADKSFVLTEEPGGLARLQVLGAPEGAPAAPAAKPTPKGATPRMQQLLDKTKPKD